MKCAGPLVVCQQWGSATVRARPLLPFEVGEIAMDFSSQALRRGEIVIWSGALEKQRHDAAVKPAPPIKEHKPRLCRRPDSADVGEFKLSDERVIRSLRRKWGIGL